VYPDYEDRIHFIVIGQDSGESAGKLRSFMNNNGYTWTTIPYDKPVNDDYRITVQASSVVMDANGIIVSRSSYSGSDRWRDLFEELLAG
jgi:hypothetical protein